MREDDFGMLECERVDDEVWARSPFPTRMLVSTPFLNGPWAENLVAYDGRLLDLRFVNGRAIYRMEGAHDTPETFRFALVYSEGGVSA